MPQSIRSFSKDSPLATHRIIATAFSILEQNPQGVRWVDLLEKIHQAEPSLHPKTVNGCVWKLAERFPDEICKPSKGVFQLKKAG
jgi:hypothetical protein